MAQAQIYGDYATISYELTVAPNRKTARASIFAESLTMNMRTGEVAEPSEFIDVDAPDLSDAITESGECTEDYASRADDSNRVQAFSPMDEGMYLSWDKGTFSDTACGVGKVTLPWDEFGIDQPEGNGGDEPATEGAGSARACCAESALPSVTPPTAMTPACPTVTSVPCSMAPSPVRAMEGLAWRGDRVGIRRAGIHARGVDADRRRRRDSGRLGRARPRRSDRLPSADRRPSPSSISRT